MYLPVSSDAVRAVEIDERSDRGEALTETDFIDAAFTDKGVEIQPITPPVESRPAQPAPAQAPKAPTPEPAPEIPDDIPPELDEWRNAYDQGQHV